MGYPCILCKSERNSSKYHFQSTNSIHSNAPLKSLIENICDITNLCNLNSYICEQCYNILNEMDALKIRLLEISKQLECFIKNHSSDTIVLAHNEEVLSNNSVDNNIKVQELKEPKDNIIKGENYAERNSNKFQKSHYSEPLKIPGELKKHLISHGQHHPFICEICGQGFKQRANFDIHIKIHNGTNPFTCVHCNKSFTQKVALVRHIPMHTGQKPFQCEECGKRFIHHSSFSVHKLSHTGEKNYKCVCCGLSLISTSHLKRHMRIHTGEKKFPCPVCGKHFAERYNLNAHKKLHQHQKTGLLNRDYSCPICGELFEKKLKLEEHTAKKHFSVI